MTLKPPPFKSRIGVLDIGSNSIRLVIYEIFGAAFTPIYNEKVLAGLGRALKDTGRLHPAGWKRAKAALARFKLIAEAQNVEKLIIGATAALRVADDAQDFVDEIFAQTGLQIQPVSGEEEAYLSAMGVLAAMPNAKGIVADLGGASLELIPLVNGKPGAGQSFPLGPFHMLDGKAPYENFDAEALATSIKAALNISDNMSSQGGTLYLVGGAWRNLAAIHQARVDYPLIILQNYALLPCEALTLAKWASGAGMDDVLSWPNVSQRRLETLPYSAVLLKVLLEQLKPKDVIISETGLREGLIFNAITPEERDRDALHDGCYDLARGNLQGDSFAAPLYDFLSSCAPCFPAYFSPEMEMRLRKAACLLAGMGKGLHPKYRAALVFEDILYAPLAGLTHAQRAYLSLMIFRSFTNAPDTPNEAAMNALLSEEARKSAETFGYAIRLAVVASGRSGDLLKQAELVYEQGAFAVKTQSGFEALLTDRVTRRLRKLNEAVEVIASIR